MKRNTYQYLIAIPMAAAMLSGSAYAACAAGSKTLFSCEIENNRQIEVCDTGSTISYSKGKPEKPGIALTIPRSLVSASQLVGDESIAYSIDIPDRMSYLVDIPNADVRYQVYVTNYKSDKGHHKIRGGVIIRFDDAYVGSEDCLEGKKIINNLIGVDLKPSE